MAEITHPDPTDLSEDIGGDEPSVWPSADEWHASIEHADNDKVTEVNDPYNPDGSLAVGKRYLLAVVEHRFRYRDDVSTPKVGQRFGEVTSRERYRIPVPDGAGIEFETVSEALRRASDGEFAPHLGNGTYDGVEVVSVMLHEYEVVPTDRPDRAWHLRRDIWKDKELIYQTP